MGGTDLFDIVGSALTAQDARLGAIASNLANVDSVTPPGQQPYRAQEVIFAASPVGDGADDGGDNNDGDATDGVDVTAAVNADLGVQVAGSVETNAPPVTKYDPGSPYADAQGNVTGSNVSQVDQMVDLIESSNSYAASVAVLQQASRIDQQMLASFQVS